MQVLRTALSGLIASAILLGLVIVADFFQRLEPTPDAVAQTRRAVVFTGQFDRIDTALALFDQGRIDRLLISGVGIGSGLRPETLADQFNFSPKARAALRSGQILLSPDAQDTFQNATEAACWLRDLGPETGVILITSVSHQPRASITLERSLPPGIPVYRASPPVTDTDRDIQREELGKFILSWLASLRPGFRLPPDHLALCKPAPNGTGP